MSVFEFDEGGSSNRWNYTDPNGDNYRTSITGDVINIDSPQSLNFHTKEPEFWDDAKTQPKLNVRLTLQSSTGNTLSWTFSPGGKRDKKSMAMAAIQAALRAAGKPGKSVKELEGLNISVATKEPPQGFKWAQGNPRPFSVRINGPAATKPKPQATQPSVPAPAGAAWEAVADAAAPAYETAPLSIYDDDIPF